MRRAFARLVGSPPHHIPTTSPRPVFSACPDSFADPTSDVGDDGRNLRFSTAARLGQKTPPQPVTSRRSPWRPLSRRIEKLQYTLSSGEDAPPPYLARRGAEGP